MGCGCVCAPHSKESLIARIIIILLFCIAQFFFGFVVLNPLFKGPRPSVISFYVLLAFWILLSILWIWSHIRTSWLDAGSLKHELERLGYLKDGKLQNLPPQLNSLNRCPKCSLPKPERTHHCSECNLCYFRFDHHCPVIGNCVALNNMKSFMLFLIYTFLLIVVFAVGCFISSVYKHIMPPIILGVIGAFIFLLGLCVGCFGFSYLPAVYVNRTTLERISGTPFHKFDEGPMQNIKQIFGNSCFSWFLPTKPPISGFIWEGITDLGFNSENENNQIENNDNQIDNQTVSPLENNNDNNNEIELDDQLSINENENNQIENTDNQIDNQTVNPLENNNDNEDEIELDDQLSINENEKPENDSIDL